MTTNTPSDAALIETVRRTVGATAAFPMKLEWGLACNVGRPTAPSAKASEDVSPSQRHPADGDEEGSTRP